MNRWLGNLEDFGRMSPHTLIELGPVHAVKDFSSLSMRPARVVELGSGTVSTVPPVNISSWNQGSQGSPLRAYPPRETEQFLVCPTLWWLHKQGYRPRVRVWEPNQLIGQAIQAGLTTHYLGLGQDPSHRALEVLRTGYVEQDRETLEGLSTLVRRGMKVALESPQMDGLSVVDAEVTIGSRRPDVIFRGSDGLVVDDNKVSRSLESGRIEARLAEYDHSWQLLDYAYHVQEHFGEPVVAARFHLIILSPRAQAIIHSIPLSPERLAQWHRSAEQVWLLMHRIEHGLLQPWMNLQACTNRGLHYGKRCGFYEACHDLEGDETRFSALYDVEEAR